MKGVRSCWPVCVGVLIAMGGTAGAQQTTNERPVRRYTGRVELHEAPSNLKIPDEKNKPTDQRHPISESKEDYIPVMPGVGGGTMPYVPPTPAVSPAKEKKNDNWVLPPKPEDLEEVGKENRSEPSGWGWLADDLKERQSRIEREAQKKADDDAALPSPVPSGSRRDADKGLLVDNTYRPVDSYELMRDMKRTDPQDMVLDTRAALSRGSATDYIDAGLTRNEVSSEPATISEGSRGVADQWWGADRVIDQNKNTQVGLSQTRTAMMESVNPGRSIRSSTEQTRSSLSQFQSVSDLGSGTPDSSRSLFGNLPGVNSSFGPGSSREKQPYSLMTDYDPFSMSKTKQDLSGRFEPLQPTKPMGAMEPFDDSSQDEDSWY